ncbi:hypothetical protein [Sphingomonas sp. 1P08PE]|uniref:hypothetical protein n=1 Tax=Sphingomonas sp. 1P08PE TaxID=554122 RepID=UPI0039A11A6B
MNVPLATARRRWLIIGGVRLAGAGGALLGLILVGRAITWGPKILGVALVLSAMLMMMVVPASLARRWRSDGR